MWAFLDQKSSGSTYWPNQGSSPRCCPTSTAPFASPPWAPSRSKCPCASAGQAPWSRGGARQGFGFPEKLGEADYRCEPWKNGWELWKNPWFVGIIIDYTYGKKGWGLPYWKNQWNLLVRVVKPIMNLPFGDSLWYWVCHIRDFTCFCYLGKWAFNLWTKTRLSKIQFNEISKGYAILLGLQLVLKLVSLLAIPLNWLGHIADLRATSELRVTSRSQACWTTGACSRRISSAKWKRSASLRVWSFGDAGWVAGGHFSCNSHGKKTPFECGNFTIDTIEACHRCYRLYGNVTQLFLLTLHDGTFIARSFPYYWGSFRSYGSSMGMVVPSLIGGPINSMEPAQAAAWGARRTVALFVPGGP